ncbi:MAG: rRNA-processing protein cgr1 [Pleopsidium flavum]|nr:MAG: rRNA-processing protein cgr1 [Pleopsidium flavum]
MLVNTASPLRVQEPAPGAQGLRKNGSYPDSTYVIKISSIDWNTCQGKQWHPAKAAFRLKVGQTSYAKRTDGRKALAAMKAKEKEMKDEKESERQRRIQAIKDKRAAKEERERYEKLAEKMHRKRVERLKRREKRNKLLKS